jgi:hypothetical protein
MFYYVLKGSMKSKGTQQHRAAEFLSVYCILLKMQVCMKRETNPLSRLRFKQVKVTWPLEKVARLTLLS